MPDPLLSAPAGDALIGSDCVARDDPARLCSNDRNPEPVRITL